MRDMDEVDRMFLQLGARAGQEICYVEIDESGNKKRRGNETLFDAAYFPGVGTEVKWGHSRYTVIDLVEGRGNTITVYLRAVPQEDVPLAKEQFVAVDEHLSEEELRQRSLFLDNAVQHMSDEFAKQTAEYREQRARISEPLKRKLDYFDALANQLIEKASPEQIAECIHFLAYSLARYKTNQNVQYLHKSQFDEVLRAEQVPDEFLVTLGNGMESFVADLCKAMGLERPKKWQ